MAASKKLSAGLIMCRLGPDEMPQVLLAHPGGPYFAKKDAGSWSLPKGLVEEGETDLLAVAKREFYEEIGLEPAAPRFHPLGHIKQKSGKVVHAWAFAGDMDPAKLKSNEFEIEWPPRSGKMETFPEVDRAQWFGQRAALDKVLAAQGPLIDRACAPEAVAALFGEPHQNGQDRDEP